MFGMHWGVCFVRNIGGVLKNGCTKSTLRKSEKTKGSSLEEKRKRKYLYLKFLTFKLKRHVLCKDINAYDPAAIKYFHKRNVTRSKNVFLAAIQKKCIGQTPKRLLSCLWRKFIQWRRFRNTLYIASTEKWRSFLKKS